jgi:hypothetical protein
MAGASSQTESLGAEDSEENGASYIERFTTIPDVLLFLSISSTSVYHGVT